MRLGYLSLALVSACSFPTDKSESVFVTLEAPSLVVLRGQDMSVYAQAWRVIGTDTQPINNVQFAFYTGSSSIARVQDDGAGYATVTGVNSGLVDINARAVAFENAGQANLSLRVSNPLEIDSVRPAVAHHGEILTVYGVGVDSMFIASLGNVDLIEYPFSRTRDPVTGLGQMSFWIPPPARSAPLFYLGAGVFGFDTVTTDVVFEDVFEPDSTTPGTIDLDLGGPWPGTVLEPILFVNPALAFEPQERDVEGRDWFKFLRSDTTRPTTFIINYPSSGADTLTRTFLLDSLGYAGTFVFAPQVTFVGSQWSFCKNVQFDPIQVNRESTIVALKELPSSHISIITFFSNQQRYGLTVLDGYLTADSRIVADRFEENDLCTFADRPAQRIPVVGSLVTFSDTLTIDNAFDIDWYRITLGAPSGTDSTLRIRTSPRPFGVQDSSDIDVYILNASGFELFSSIATRSFEDITVNLAAGTYYVVVVDYAGVATRYSMCMSARRALFLNNCALQPGAPGGAPHAPAKPKPSRVPGLQPAAPMGTGGSPFGGRQHR